MSCRLIIWGCCSLFKMLSSCVTWSRFISFLLTSLTARVLLVPFWSQRFTTAKRPLTQKTHESLSITFNVQAIHDLTHIISPSFRATQSYITSKVEMFEPSTNSHLSCYIKHLLDKKYDSPLQDSVLMHKTSTLDLCLHVLIKMVNSPTFWKK